MTEGLIIELLKYNGNPIGVELPANVTLRVALSPYRECAAIRPAAA